MNTKQREQLFRRDNFRCQRCGSTEKRLSPHHVLARRYGGTDDLDNLISYCYSCHKVVEPPRKMGPITSLLYRHFSTIRIHDKTYEYLAKNVIYPESMAETLDRLLGLKK